MELAHGIIEAGKSKLRRVGWQARDPGRSQHAVQVQRPATGKISSSSREFSLFLLRPSTD